MAGPPPGQRRGQQPGPHDDPEEEGRRDPGLFDVPEGDDDDDDDEEDAHSRVSHNTSIARARNC